MKYTQKQRQRITSGLRSIALFGDGIVREARECADYIVEPDAENVAFALSTVRERIESVEHSLRDSVAAAGLTWDDIDPAVVLVPKGGG